MKGFFQLIGKADGTYMRFVPFEQSDEITMNDINLYLTEMRIFRFDAKAINKLVTEAKEKVEIKLNGEPLIPTDEHVRVIVEPDNMRAKVRFYPPSNGGKKITAAEIKSSLAMAEVKYGILEDKINLLIEKGRVYCRSITIAKATPVTYGHDASIEYFFPTELNSKPRMNADGTVDFHHLDNIAHVEAGDLLARLTLDEPGKPGINVLGDYIKPPNYQKKKLKYGNNITISEDGLELYSDFAGHVSLVEGKVFVANQYEVEDVDSSTGDIEYEGNVLVKGNVRSGFEIKAQGEIRVRGVVESAVLIAGGDIILERGIQGMGKGMLQAGGNVISKFIESATVKAGGYVHTEAILHSTVSGKEEVLVQGKKGFITGGVISSLNKVTAKTIGSPMGTDTVVEVGIDPEKKERQEELLARTKELNAEIEKIAPALTNYAKQKAKNVSFTQEQIKYIQVLSANYKKLNVTLQEVEEEMEEISRELMEGSNARIKVTDRIYSDVKLVVSDGIMFVRDEQHHCQFIYEAGEVKSVSL